MLQSILVPLDGSPLAEMALEPAMLLARRCEAELWVVRTINPELLPEGTARFAATHEAQRYLDSIADFLQREDLVVRTALLPLDPAEGISDEADFRQVDLIVMATHGRSGVNALLHPSVTWQVLHQTIVPVLACKCAEGTDPAALTLHLPRFLTDAKAPILVALDGSTQAEEALPIAADLARSLGNPLLLVRAGEQPFIAGGAVGSEMLVSQAWEWSLEEAENYVKRMGAELASTGLRVQTKAGMGNAAAFIQQVAAEHGAGLIVLASHGRGWLGRVVMGSVAHSVLQEAEIPVLLVPRLPLPASEPAPTEARTPEAAQR